MKLTQAERFFFEHAGYSYGPGETARQGRIRGAKALARAEVWAKTVGLTYEWSDDPDGADIQKEDGTWERLPAVQVVTSEVAKPACSKCGHVNREWSSLGGITESDDQRERANYRRVVEAELAADVRYRINQE